MTQFDTSTGEHEPKSGLVLTGFLSLTRTGTAVGSLTGAMTEVGSTARYAVALLGSDIDSALTALVTAAGGKLIIYERVTGTGYQDNEPLLVTAARQAGE